LARFTRRRFSSSLQIRLATGGARQPAALPASSNVLLVAAAVHRGLVDADDLLVALHDGVAEITAIFRQ